MNEFIFATEHVLTSQGWFAPGHLMPKHDLPEEEGLKLLNEEKAAICSYDSPLAAAVHESRKMDPHAASVFLKDAMKTLSPSSPGGQDIEIDAGDTEPPSSDDKWIDPTPEGEFPTPENFVRAGYKLEHYEGHKANFLKLKEQDAADAAKRTELGLPPDAVIPSGTSDGKPPASSPPDETKPPEGETTAAASEPSSGAPTE